MQSLKTALLNKLLLCVACCGLALGLPGRTLAQAALAQADQSQTIATASSELPDSPGTAWARAQEASSQSNSAQSAPSTQAGTSQLPAAADQTQKPQRPVGTAAAEAPKANGVAAAQPAGIAIAPAKQHRVRTIVLKVGAMVGAGVAVGTVIALTEGTSSKPPGAH